MNEEDQLKAAPWTVYNVAQGLLVYAGKVLLVGNDYGGPALVWSLPGGRLEPGEQAETALVREVREETGLVVLPGDLLYIMDARSELDHRHYLTAVFEVRLPVAPVAEPAVSFGQDPAVKAVRWVPFALVAELIERPSLGEGLVNYLYYGERLARHYWRYPEYRTTTWQPLKWPPAIGSL